MLFVISYLQTTSFPLNDLPLADRTNRACSAGSHCSMLTSVGHLVSFMIGGNVYLFFFRLFLSFKFLTNTSHWPIGWINAPVHNFLDKEKNPQIQNKNKRQLNKNCTKQEPSVVIEHKNVNLLFLINHSHSMCYISGTQLYAAREGRFWMICWKGIHPSL